MKYYYLKDDQREGPFELNELLGQGINKKTLIWTEGFKDWKPAGEIQEISDKLPPDLYATEESKPDIYDKIYKVIRIIIIIIISIFAINVIMDHLNVSNRNDEISYEEHVMTIEEIEEANPLNYLSTTGSYTTNFWGTKFKVDCKLINKATVAHYKDIKLRFSLLSKTGTEIHFINRMIYEELTPTSSKIVNLKIDIPSDDVKKINWEIIGATPIR